MASEAQVIANRRNAEKSTGPRSPAGKAAVSENAVTHGLSGRRDVIKGEDQAQFDRHREALLKELRPDGALESMLAERVVSLSWRLERVGRMQNEVFDALLAKESTPLAKLARSMIPGKAAEDDGLDLGRAVIKDFANSRVLDRLLMYERRTENSPLKTLNDVHLRRLRVWEYISRHMDEIGSEPVGSMPVRASRSTGILPVMGNHGREAHATKTPDGVTANVPGAADADGMSPTRMAHDSNIPSLQDSIPIPGESDADRMSATRMAQHSTIPSFQDSVAGADEPVGAEPPCKTKPICGPGPIPGNILDGWHRQTRFDGAPAVGPDHPKPHGQTSLPVPPILGSRLLPQDGRC